MWGEVLGFVVIIYRHGEGKGQGRKGDKRMMKRG